VGGWSKKKKRQTAARKRGQSLQKHLSEPRVYSVTGPGGRTFTATSIAEFDLLALDTLAIAAEQGEDSGGEFDARAAFIERVVDLVVPGEDDWGAIWTLVGWNRDFFVLPPVGAVAVGNMTAAQVACACIGEYVVALFRRSWQRVRADTRDVARRGDEAEP
jgi:hypothetical protein